MRAASQAGDVQAVLEHLRKVEANKAQWWAAAGPTSARTPPRTSAGSGEIALAHEHLEMAKELSTDADALIAMARGVAPRAPRRP